MKELDQIQAELNDKVQQAPLAQVPMQAFLHAIFKLMMLCARKYLEGK